MNSVYICYYEMCGRKKYVMSTVGIAIFKDGFWVNDLFELTQGSDCSTWIPPSRILYIDKESRDI